MLDVEKLQNLGEKVHVEASDRIFEELGDNTYDFKDLISELIDNSIAARRLDRKLNVTIEIWVDPRNIAQTMLIKDDALGIPEDRMGLAISPAALQTPDSLNEHGLGMKQAIAGLGRLRYLATKTAGEPKARVVCEFKFGDIDCLLSDFDSDSGTEICVDNIKPIANVHPTSITTSLAPYLGARYRRFLKPENKLVNITIFTRNAKTGTVLYSWDIVEYKPIYFHPSSRTNKPVFLNKKLKGSGWKAELTFGYGPTDDELKEVGLEKLPQHHPYNISMAKQGLDVILYDRVVLFHQLSELGIVVAKHPDYNLIRGEITLLEGFSTAITKNSIIREGHFLACIDEVKGILTGKGQEDEKNYLRQKKYPKEIPEKLLRDRLANWLGNNPLNKKGDVKTEYAVQGLAGNIDILADGEAWEIKRDQASGLDVYQLFAYMDMGQIQKGYLLAANFSTGAEAAKDFIKSNHGKEITLAKLEQFPINHLPSDEERNIYY